MFNVQTATFLATFITYIIAYFITVPAGGALRAWVAKKCGDSTPEDLGFLTLNPIAHCDTVGFIMLFFSYIGFRHFFGWGAFVPINPFNFTGRWGTVKLLFTSVADVVGYLISALFWMILLIIFFDYRMTMIIHYSIMKHAVIDHTSLLKLYPDVSQIWIIVAMILIATIVLSVTLGLVYLIRNIFMLIPFIRMRNADYDNNNFWISFVAPALCIIFLMPVLLRITTGVLITCAMWAAGYIV